MESKKLILFVDDEERILSGFRRMLRSKRNVWEIYYSTTGQEAIKIISEKKINVLITDIRMPQMDGIDVLKKTIELSPNTKRIVLSGHADKEAAFEATKLAHQFLTKPCSTKQIIDKITYLLMLDEKINNPNISRLITEIGGVPSLPKTYREALDEINKKEPSLHKLGQIVAKDIGLSAKFLQIVNSSFFALSRHISSPVDATNYLGLNIIKRLILGASIFSKYGNIPEITIIWDHSLKIANLARLIAQKIGSSTELIELCYVSGLLQDIGLLFFALYDVDLLKKLKANIDKESVLSLEQKLFYTNHADVSSYLIGIWGLPDQIVEIVAFHHNPEKATESLKSPISILALANKIIDDEENYPFSFGIDLEQEWLSKIDTENIIEELNTLINNI